jgi:hypothetical protein
LTEEAVALLSIRHPAKIEDVVEDFEFATLEAQ